MQSSYFDIQSEIQSLETQKADLIEKAKLALDQERIPAIEEIVKLISLYGITSPELFPAKPTKQSAELPAKYKDPITGKVWSGRGGLPDWVGNRVDLDRYLNPDWVARQKPKKATKEAKVIESASVSEDISANDSSVTSAAKSPIDSAAQLIVIQPDNNPEVNATPIDVSGLVNSLPPTFEDSKTQQVIGQPFYLPGASAATST